MSTPTPVSLLLSLISHSFPPLSAGHDIPGEGEHKVMEYIRWEKRRPEYVPNQVRGGEEEQRLPPPPHHLEGGREVFIAHRVSHRVSS